MEKKGKTNVLGKGLVSGTLLRVAVDSDVVPVAAEWRVDRRVVPGTEELVGRTSAESGFCCRFELDIGERC